MKRLLIVVVVVVLITGLYLVISKNYFGPGGGYIGHVVYYCSDETMPGGQLSFTIEKQSDGQMHLVIASKPPNTDIVVSKTELALFSYEYSGNGVDVKDSTGTLQVNLNGKMLQNCKKVYPGV